MLVAGIAGVVMLATVILLLVFTNTGKKPEPDSAIVTQTEPDPMEDVPLRQINLNDKGKNPYGEGGKLPYEGINNKNASVLSLQ